MEKFQLLSFTHKHLDFKSIGLLVANEENKSSILNHVKRELNLEELFYLSTCNRVEIAFVRTTPLSRKEFGRLFLLINPTLSQEQIDTISQGAVVYHGLDAFEHFFKVSCSLDSMVIGEKEIFGQFKSAYGYCKDEGLTADTLRLLMRGAVENAKEIYSQTEIARKPVSVVSLAFRELRELIPTHGARILFVGAGETNQLMSKYLQKHGDYSYAVFNRTESRAQKFANDIQGEAYTLDQLKNYNKGFDLIISCTSSTDPIIDKALMQKLIGTEKGHKIVVDLAIPNDVAADVSEIAQVISINELKKIAAANLNARRTQLREAEAILEVNFEAFKKILKQRKIELAMRQVPDKIKEIKANAVNEVFARELTELDPDSREVLDKVLNYMEKKYISVPMVMARDILLDQ